jgi:hypothetical protein
VLVLQEGEVVERATSTPGRSAHDQLLDREGDYYRLYTGQFRGEAEGEIPARSVRGGDGRRMPTATATATA